MDISSDELKQLFAAARTFDARGQLSMFIGDWHFVQKRPGEVQLRRGTEVFTGSTAVLAVAVLSLDDDPYGPPVG